MHTFGLIENCYQHHSSAKTKSNLNKKHADMHTYGTMLGLFIKTQHLCIIWETEAVFCLVE